MDSGGCKDGDSLKGTFVEFANSLECRIEYAVGGSDVPREVMYKKRKEQQ